MDKPKYWIQFTQNLAYLDCVIEHQFGNWRTFIAINNVKMEFYIEKLK